jgi:TolB protein
VVGGPPYNSGGADWSHSKKLIAFQSNRLGTAPQIFLMNLDGTEQQLLLSVAGGAAFPSFSHNGNELCFQSQTAPRRDIYIANVHGDGLTNLTSLGQIPGQLGASGDNFRCDWSPKSNAIAFTSNRHDPAGTLPANRNDEIYAMNADGSDVVRLTGGDGQEPAPGTDANPVWSPKGDRIAFESNRTGRPEIWVMDADGSNQVQLTDFDDDAINPTNITVTKPTWSPTGDRIAFQRRVGLSGQRGHFEVYTMDADGTDVTQITFTPTPGFSGFPSWGKWSAHP